MTATLDGPAVDIDGADDYDMAADWQQSTIDAALIDAARLEYAADLEQRLRDARADLERQSADLERHRTMLEQSHRDREDANSRTLQARQELEQFQQRVWEAVAREADARNWCSEADDWLESLGLPRLERVWSVTVPVGG